MNLARTCLAVLAGLVLAATGAWAAAAQEEPAAAMEKEMVTDPTTGEMVTAPQYGGTLTFATMLEPPSADTLVYGSAGLAIGGVAEQLIIPNWAVDRDEYDFSNQYIPVDVAAGQLAESWEISPDGLTYTFHIRKGVHWHNKAPMNGRELTAQDIEYNYHRIWGLGSGYTEPLPGSLLEAIGTESVTATDQWTVEFKLKEPNPGALHKIMVVHIGFILPREVIEQHGDISDWRNFVGTGPYELTDWVQGTSITHTRNPDYWGFDEKYPQNRLPYTDKLVGLFIMEEATRLAGLRSGRIDFLGFPAGVSDIVSADVLDSLRKTDPEIDLVPWWDRSENSVALDTTKPPFDDIRVRKAMQIALDLQTINDTYYKGTAMWKPQGPVGEGLKGYYTPFDEWPDEVKKNYAYDPERARQLLAEAGYPDGFETALVWSSEGDLGYAEIAAGYWKAIGVDVEIRGMDRPQLIPLLTGGDYGGMAGAVTGWSHPYGAVPVLRNNGHSTSIWNIPSFKDAELDAMIEAGESATSLAEEQRLAREADMYMIEKHVYLWGPKAGKYMAVQPWVEGYNGEVHFGGQHRLPILARLWIDSELKEAMGH
ncbi:MAG: ABC transporter substrate-binding protein [Spirochaetaceae bacterium]|nr:ABC transporter substrate-binding protein [Spirochaetaceae bacterium]